MTARQFLIDAATRHQVFLQRYAGSSFKELSTFIDGLIDETTTLLRNAPDNMSRTRYNRLLKELREVNTAILNDFRKTARKQATELAEYEAGFTKRLIDQATDTTFETVIPATRQLQAAAFTTIMDQVPGFNKRKGLTVQDALSQFGRKKASEIVSTARTGFALGRTNKEIADDIQQLSNTIIKRQAETLTRTITNHVASQARNTFYDENDEILGNYRVVATLDSRTSHTCQSLDGKEFTPKEFNTPPYHWNCRSTYIRVPKEEYQADLPQFGRRARGPEGQEIVGSGSTYGGWLKDQPKAFRVEALGKQRAKLFDAGMRIDKFTDDKTFETLTIDQLSTKDNQHIFEEAGL